MSDKSEGLFLVGLLFAGVGIGLILIGVSSLILANTQCGEGCQKIACEMNETQCHREGVGVTEVVVRDSSGKLRSVTVLDECTGEYKYFNETLHNHTLIPKEGEAIGGGSGGYSSKELKHSEPFKPSMKNQSDAFAEYIPDIKRTP